MACAPLYAESAWLSSDTGLLRESVSHPNSSSRKSASAQRRLPRSATTAAPTTTHTHGEPDIVNLPPVASVASDAAESTYPKRWQRNLHLRVNFKRTPATTEAGWRRLGRRAAFCRNPGEATCYAAPTPGIAALRERSRGG